MLIQWIFISLSISCSFFPPAPSFLCHIPLSLSIFRMLLGHDKSKRDVMTQDPLLALGGGRGNERERERRGGGGREKKDERDLSGNDCSQGIDSLL